MRNGSSVPRGREIRLDCRASILWHDITLYRKGVLIGLLTYQVLDFTSQLLWEFSTAELHDYTLRTKAMDLAILLTEQADRGYYVRRVDTNFHFYVYPGGIEPCGCLTIFTPEQVKDFLERETDL